MVQNEDNWFFVLVLAFNSHISQVIIKNVSKELPYCSQCTLTHANDVYFECGPGAQAQAKVVRES